MACLTHLSILFFKRRLQNIKIIIPAKDHNPFLNMVKKSYDENVFTKVPVSTASASFVFQCFATFSESGSSGFGALKSAWMLKAKPSDIPTSVWFISEQYNDTELSEVWTPKLWIFCWFLSGLINSVICKREVSVLDHVRIGSCLHSISNRYGEGF